MRNIADPVPFLKHTSKEAWTAKQSIAPQKRCILGMPSATEDMRPIISIQVIKVNIYK